jgi:hypothetical protein
MWDELFADYYLLVKDKDGNLPYHMFSRFQERYDDNCER